jgi:phenylacetate-CoA ligase
MTEYYDALETRDPAEREAALFARLPGAAQGYRSAGYAERLQGIDPASVTSRAAGEAAGAAQVRLPALHRAAPPFGGFVPGAPGSFGRLFTSPGRSSSRSLSCRPLARRAAFAAGFRPDVVLNTFSYHLTPGGFFDAPPARSLRRDSAGPGNTEQQFELIEAIARSAGHAGFPEDPARCG